MRPPIRVMFSEVYLGKVLNFSLAFQKPLESQPVMNYRGVLLNLIVILKKRERRRGEEGWRVRDTEETEREEEGGRKRRDERKCERRGRKVERLLFIQ